MARMIPPEINPDVSSTAERRLFETVRTELSDDWIALHSLGLARHDSKPWAEIDYLLIGPPGIYCLEVKGGRIRRSDGVWQFIDGADRVHTRYEGPFEQAATAAAALYRYLERRLSWITKSVVAYGVVMPDIRFDEDGPDIETAVLYDRRDAGKSLASYLRRLAAYWHDHYETQRRRPLETLSERECRTLLDLLRGDFDFRPSLAARMRYASDELIRLTDEQYRVLDGLADNPRVIVTGGAGTGKTLLAVEEARRRSRMGSRVLFCCYNRNLAAYLRRTVRDLPGVAVRHLHGLMADLVDQAGLRSQLPDAEPQDLFAVFYPRLTVDALITLDRLQENDVLIVDEFQDLAGPSYLEVFDALLAGGLADGDWRFFMDPHQDVYGALNSAAWRDVRAHGALTYRLSVNCRNTEPVAVAGSILSGFPQNPVLTVDGPEVDHLWYRDQADQLRQVSRCINRLLGDGVAPADIAVLSPYRLARSSVAAGIPGVPFPLVEVSDTSSQRGASIAFSTVRGFKGLESEAVLLVDVDKLEDSDSLSSVYVGVSRARTYLAVFLDDRLQEVYRNLAFEYGRRLTTVSTQ